jgi:murein DD-endopeptidase MepM/ murein hydrolase activator NlpD
MTRKRFRGALPLAVFAAFIAGVVVDSWVRTYGPPQPRIGLGSDPARLGEPPTTTSVRAADTRGPTPIATSGDRSNGRLRLPIDGVDVESLKGGFAETRGSNRPHEAVDILAPRNTPIHAVEDGKIAKLFTSKAGGLTIYQFDPQERRCYYYAHLERYADRIAEGQTVSQGDVIGYVGTSGNAPANTPHLHFAVFELNADKHWWQGTPIDPYRVFRDRE